MKKNQGGGIETWGKMVIFSRDRLTKKATSEQRPKRDGEVHRPAISGDEAPQAKESEHNGLGLKLPVWQEQGAPG